MGTGTARPVDAARTAAHIGVRDAAIRCGAGCCPRSYGQGVQSLTRSNCVSQNVRVFEEPQGHWFGIAAEVSVGSDGVGTNSAVLHGSQGPVGRITRNQLVERRAAARS